MDTGWTVERLAALKASLQDAAAGPIFAKQVAAVREAILLVDDLIEATTHLDNIARELHERAPPKP